MLKAINPETTAAWGQLARHRQALGSTRLSITDIFRFPTLEALARHLDDRPADTAAVSAETAERAQMRTDAMSRRRAMRAGQGSGS